MARKPGWAKRQAQRDALLRYGPEIAALLELQNQAVDTFNTTRNAARANSRSVIAQTRAAMPVVKDTFNDALAANTATSALVNANAATQSPEIRAALAQEQATAAGRIGESRAQAVTDIQQRRIGAREGRGFAIGQARKDFAKDIGTILRRKQSLATESGAFAAQQAANYRTDAAQRRAAQKLALLGLQQDERQSIRASGIDPNTGQPIPGGKLDPDANSKPGDQTPDDDDGGGNGKNGWRTPAARAEAGDRFDSLVSTVNRYHPHAGGDTIATLKRRIVAGDPGKEAQPVRRYDEVADKWVPVYNKNGTPKMSAGRPATEGYAGPEILLDAALEQAILGHITRPTAAKLRRRGLRPRQLGDVQRPNPGRGWVPPQGVAGPK